MIFFEEKSSIHKYLKVWAYTGILYLFFQIELFSLIVHESPWQE